ncbi:MAG: ATP-binding protein [Acidimicrobiales bacterium]
MDDQHIELEFPARAEYVALARLVVSSLASARRDIDDDRIDDLKIAVSEACTNAIEAHSAGATNDQVVLRCVEHDDRLEVVIRDFGPGFEPAELPEDPPVTDPERLDERGLGIPLIKTLVDDAQFESADEGTIVTLVMQCGRAVFVDDDVDVTVDGR